MVVQQAAEYIQHPLEPPVAVAETEEIHTLQMAQPVAINDALSQAIREHLTQTGLGDVQLDSLQSYEVNGGTTDGIEYGSMLPEDQQADTPGYLKQILMDQFEDK